jgi:ribosomal protein S18 acetylase RimI-like enzyme
MLYPPSTDAYAGEVEPSGWPELRLLAVAEEARGQGVARALVDECIRYSRLSGANALGLHTSRSMIPAIRLYEGFGFTRAPEYDFHPEGAETVTAYRLRLDAIG